MQTTRYSNIDGLRAIAALSVVIEHMCGDIIRQTINVNTAFRSGLVMFTQNVSLGRFGVALFFLISGFVIPFSFRRQRPLINFTISRIMRLYPAMWLAISILAMMQWLNGLPPAPKVVLANLSMAPTFFRQPWLSPIYWTLFIEVLFYVCVGILFAWGRLNHIKTIISLAVILVLSTLVPAIMAYSQVRVLPIQYVGFHLSFLFLGFLIRFAMVDRIRLASHAVLAVAALQGATIFVVADFSLARADGFILGGPAAILAAYLSAIMAFCAALKFSVPRSSLLARVGLISYSIYLFHWIININIYNILHLTGHPSDLMTMLICIIAILIASDTIYRFVEKPMIKLGRTISAKLDEQAGFINSREVKMS